MAPAQHREYGRAAAHAHLEVGGDAALLGVKQFYSVVVADAHGDRDRDDDGGDGGDAGDAGDDAEGEGEGEDGGEVVSPILTDPQLTTPGKGKGKGKQKEKGPKKKQDDDEDDDDD